MALVDGNGKRIKGGYDAVVFEGERLPPPEHDLCSPKVARRTSTSSSAEEIQDRNDHALLI
jgi:hypothetical protein